MLRSLIFCCLVIFNAVSGEIDERPVVIRLQPQSRKPNFLKEIAPPRAVLNAHAKTGTSATTHVSGSLFKQHLTVLIIPVTAKYSYNCIAYS